MQRHGACPYPLLIRAITTIVVPAPLDSRRAALFAIRAFVSTLQQTCFLAPYTRSLAVATGSTSTMTATASFPALVGRDVRVDSGVIVRDIEAEFRLDSARMDTVFVQALTNLPGKRHIPRGSLALEVKVDLDVQRSNELRVRELPHVDVVA